MHTVPCADSSVDRLPVGDAPAMPATNRAQCPVALDVGCGRLRMAFDLHRSELEIHPRTADPAAERAIAQGGDFGRGGQGEADRAAMAGAFMHGQAFPV